MKIGLLLICLLLCTFLFSQDTNWHKVQVTEDLTLSLPGKVTAIDSTVKKNDFSAILRIIEAEANNSSIGIVVTPNETKIDINDRQSLDSMLEKIARGICENVKIQGINCNIYDTIIDKVESKKVLAYYENNSAVLGTQYVFFVNDRMYLITQSPTLYDEKIIKNELNMLLNSIHFNHTNIKEQQFASKAESKGYSAGWYFGRILGFLTMGAVFWFAIKGFNNKSQNASI